MITVWLPVRVLPAPPRSPALTPSSPSPRNTLDFPRFGAGVMARSRSLRETKTVRKRIGALRLWTPEIRFPVRGQGPAECMPQQRGHHVFPVTRLIGREPECRLGPTEQIKIEGPAAKHVRLNGLGLSRRALRQRPRYGPP